jgi:hypothetical protein
MKQYIFFIKKYMMYQDSNEIFNYRIIFIMFMFIYMEQYILSIKENIMCQDSNKMLIIE